MPQGEYLQYGGQAIVEGVMMRSPKYFAVACRAPNGAIVVQTEALEKTWIGRQNWLKLPFLRGTFALLDSMALGIRSMRFAANVQLDPVYAKPQEPAEKLPSKSIQNVTVAGAMVVGLGMGILIFQYLPNLVAEMSRKAGVTNPTAINYIAEVLKVIFFLGYIGLIGLMKEVKTLFQYHGAEHKAINVLEADEPLTSENCRAQTRLHPRCGTSFAMIVLIVGFILMPLVPRYPVTGGPGNPFVDVSVRVLVELMILPLVAGISYEALRVAGKFRNERWVKAAFAPGLASQYLTTREPTDDQIEVARVSLEAVVRAEASGELTNTVVSGPSLPEPQTG